MTRFAGFISALLIAGFAVGAGNTNSEQRCCSLRTSLDLLSAFVFRGSTLNDDWVFRPTAEVDICSLKLGAEGNYDMGDYAGAVERDRFSCVVLQAAAHAISGSFDFEAGYRAYRDQYVYMESNVPELATQAEIDAYWQEVDEKKAAYPRPDLAQDDGAEWYAEVAFDSVVKPSLSVSMGTEGFLRETTYVVADLSTDYYKDQKWTMGVSAALYYVDQRDGVDGLSHCLFTHTLTRGLFTTSISYIRPVDRRILKRAEDGGPMDIRGYGSIGFGYVF